MMGPNCWWWGPGYFFGGPLGWIFGLLFWGLILYGAFRLIANLTNHSSAVARSESSALEILKKRYAKGEIDAEEFAKRKTDLES